MKKILVTVLMMCFASYMQAQDANPVKWSASTIIEDDAERLVVKAMIEKPWHIFTSKPGGDGFAIPTSIVLVNGGDSTVVGDRTANRKPVKKNIEGMGMMSFFEGDVEFKIILAKPLTKDARLYITYQCCNDYMCLPPVDMSLEIK